VIAGKRVSYARHHLCADAIKNQSLGNKTRNIGHDLQADAVRRESPKKQEGRPGVPKLLREKGTMFTAVWKPNKGRCPGGRSKQRETKSLDQKTKERIRKPRIARQGTTSWNKIHEVALILLKKHNGHGGGKKKEGKDTVANSFL